MTKDFDIRDLPSWKYMGWGALNGIFLGISIKQGIDISETGILVQVLEAFKPLFEMFGQIGWIKMLIFFLGVIAIFSFIIEIVTIYNKGWPTRIIASSGFLSLLLLILGINTLGIIIFLIGGFMVMRFPDE